MGRPGRDRGQASRGAGERPAFGRLREPFIPAKQARPPAVKSIARCSHSRPATAHSRRANRCPTPALQLAGAALADLNGHQLAQNPGDIHAERLGVHSPRTSRSLSVMRSVSWRVFGCTQESPAPRSRTVPACTEGRTLQRRAPFRSGMSATSLTRYNVSRLSVPSRWVCPE